MSLSDTWGQISEATSRPQRGLPTPGPSCLQVGVPLGYPTSHRIQDFSPGVTHPNHRGGAQLSVETKKETEWEGAPAEGPDPSTAHAPATKTQERGPWRPETRHCTDVSPKERSGWGPRGHGLGHPLTRLDGLEDALLQQSFAL